MFVELFRKLLSIGLVFGVVNGFALSKEDKRSREDICRNILDNQESRGAILKHLGASELYIKVVDKNWNTLSYENRVKVLFDNPSILTYGKWDYLNSFMGSPTFQGNIEWSKVWRDTLALAEVRQLLSDETMGDMQSFTELLTDRYLRARENNRDYAANVLKSDSLLILLNGSIPKLKLSPQKSTKSNLNYIPFYANLLDAASKVSGDEFEKIEPSFNQSNSYDITSFFNNYREGDYSAYKDISHSYRLSKFSIDKEDQITIDSLEVRHPLERELLDIKINSVVNGYYQLRDNAKWALLKLTDSIYKDETLQIRKAIDFKRDSLWHISDAHETELDFGCYSVARSKNISSVIELTSSDIEGRNATTLSSLLQGLAVGVLASQSQGRAGGEGGSLIIRGKGSELYSEPYILVDGVELLTVDMVDLSDIAKITFLKDGASSAIYGDYGANGVVLVETKRGGDSKPKLTYSGYVGLQSPTMLVERMSAEQYATFYDKYSLGDAPKVINNTSWQEELYSSGIEHRHNFSFQGGTDRFNHYSSVGYLYQDGVIENSSRRQYNARTNLDFMPIKRFGISLGLSYMSNTLKDPFTPTADSYGSEDIINGFENLSPWLSLVSLKGDNPVEWLENGDVFSSTIDNFNSNLQLSYQASKYFKIKTNGTYQLESQKWNNSNFRDDSGRTSSLNLLGEFQKEFDNFSLLGFVVGGEIDDNRYVEESDAVKSCRLFARGNYSFKGRYFVEGSFVRDNTLFGDKSIGDNIYPSYALGWRVDREKFMRFSRGFLTNLMVRYSYGESGSWKATNSDYLSKSSYLFGSSGPYLIEDDTWSYNPVLAAEKSKNVDFGVDLSLFDKLSFVYDRYTKYSSGVVMSGSDGEFANMGSVENSGNEFSVAYNNRWRNFRLSLSAMVAVNNNMITDLGGDILSSRGDRVGSNIDSFYLLKANGLIKSQVDIDQFYMRYENKLFDNSMLRVGDINLLEGAGVSNDGVLDLDDRVNIASSLSSKSYSFIFSFGFKGVDVGATIYGTSGAMRYFGDTVFGVFNGDNGAPSTAWLDSYSVDNIGGSMPRVAYYGTSINDPSTLSSTFWLQDASYLRLKNLQVSYTFPLQVAKKLMMSGLKIYYSGENLFTSHDMMINVDPESPSGKGCHYPILKMNSIGVVAQF